MQVKEINRGVRRHQISRTVHCKKLQMSPLAAVAPTRLLSVLDAEKLSENTQLVHGSNSLINYENGRKKKEDENSGLL